MRVCQQREIALRNAERDRGAARAHLEHPFALVRILLVLKQARLHGRERALPQDEECGRALAAHIGDASAQPHALAGRDTSVAAEVRRELEVTARLAVRHRRLVVADTLLGLGVHVKERDGREGGVRRLLLEQRRRGLRGLRGLLRLGRLPLRLLPRLALRLESRFLLVAFLGLLDALTQPRDDW